MKSSLFALPGWSGRAFIWRIFGLHKFFTPFWERVAGYGTNDGGCIFHPWKGRKHVKEKTILAGILMVVLGAVSGAVNLYDVPEPICRPNQVCPDGTQTIPLCVPGKTCPIKM